MQYTIIPVTSYQQNCTLLWCKTTHEGMVVDPGGDIHRIIAAIQQHEVILKGILLTHGHLDHVGGTVELAKRYHVPVIGPHQDDDFWLKALPDQSRAFGFAPHLAFKPERWLTEGEVVRFGNVELQVRHTPGHTPGHVVFFEPKTRLALVGDVLFSGSIGRTDFPKGDHETLIHSIQSKLWTLGNDVAFIPGHGPMSTFGEERRTNPFVADR
jgi:glyoxylase-like metal-dependent hydrolase (beta-lactamase superfamily II)